MTKYCLVALSLLVISNFSFGQEFVVTYEAKDKPLTQIFRDLEKAYNIHFAYSTRQLKGKRGSTSAQNENLSDFLAALLRPHQLVHELVETKFVSVTNPESVFLRAQVVDQSTGESLPFATMRLKDTYQGAIADVDGNLNVVIDEPLDAVLEFSFLGYEPYEMEVEGYDNQERIQVELTPETQNLQQVVIKEYINNGITTDQRAAKITINPLEMEILPGLSERDILLSAQILAGINSNDESASGMNVRGSARDNTFIYWNNIPIYQSAHYFGNISSFIPSSIGSVDIYKNHIPVQYSGASAAMILVESQKSTITKPEFESSLNFTHADLYGRVPFLKDQGSFMIALRRSYNDWFATPTFNAISDKLFDGSITQDIQKSVDEDFRYNSKLTFSDINLQWIYEPSGKDRFTLSALRSASVLDYNSINEEEEIESVQNHEVSNIGINLQWDHRWGEKLQTNFSASLSSYDMDYGLSEFRELGTDSDDDITSRANFLRNTEIRLTNDYALSQNHVLKFGYQANFVDAQLRIDESNFFEEDFDKLLETGGIIHGIFADYSAKLGEKWQVGAGLRFNGLTSINDMFLDPQLRVSYDLNKHWLLKGSMGTYRQFLNAVQETEFTFSNSVELNWILADIDETVPVVENRQAVIGFLFDKDGWLVDLDIYRKDIDGILARNFSQVMNDEDGFALGNERVTGIDLTVKKKWKNYKAWLSYGYQDSQADIPDLRLFGFTSGLNIRHQLQFSQTLNVKQFEFSLGYTVKSGLPFTNVRGPFLITQPRPGDDPNDFEPYYDFEVGQINDRRLPTYHRVDLSAWYKFPKSRGSKVRGEVGISILNLLNRNNLFSRTFGFDFFDDDEVGLFQFDKRLLGITPNFSFRLKF